MDIYPWVVFIHISGAFTFALAHGVSAFAAFKIREERDPDRLRALLEVSSLGIGTMYIGLLVLLVAGIAGGMMRGWFAMGWIWAALGVLIVVVVLMYALATRYYGAVRTAVGLASSSSPKNAPPPPPATPAELARLLDTRRPEALAGVGVVGLLVIIWLMVLKPF